MQLRKFRAGQAAPASDWEKNTDKNFDALAQDLYQLLNNGIVASDNFSCTITTVTTSGVPGTVTTIAHGLARTPIGYIVLSKDKAAHIYNTTAADGTNVYIKSDVATVTVKLLIL